MCDSQVIGIVIEVIYIAPHVLTDRLRIETEERHEKQTVWEFV